jgi:uncharacterized protein YkwD
VFSLIPVNQFSMNWIDILLVLVVAFAMWQGWHKGFINGSINLTIWLGSLSAGFFSYKYVGDVIIRSFPSLGVWVYPVSFILITIIVRTVLSLLFNNILKDTSDKMQRHEVNHLLGLIPGFINGIVYATILVAFLLSAPLVQSVSVTTKDSKIADNLSGNIEWLDNKLSPIFENAVNKTFVKYTVEPASNETVHLHFTVSNSIERKDLESKMLDLVNEERSKRGLSFLKADESMTEVGKSHAIDMFQRGYFSHYSPEHVDPFQRMKSNGIHFLSAGENLALGQSLLICHEGLMNSPGHRANILNPSFHRVGIAILDGGPYGLMITQEFRN